ncbi:DUF4142 domain-containing protein [Sphingobium sp. AP49]|uniref:DUF4142 domain-containing protein n=1 Tax=Sphingobium sp. AP49 TaxID=1144307 RepID=UPI00026EE787|nr:DUF4142 domain-containing protein [Sphingobium sp. AP49]WHO39434.1 DUF4142 domain-containing protein [Sphingobium sp. AP49]
MKTQLTIVAISLAALTLGGCGKKADTMSGENGAMAYNSANAAQAPVAETQGQQFANVAAASDAFEIESSKLAETNSQSASVKKFAASMIKAHGDSSAKLADAARSASPSILPNPALTPDQQETLNALKGKKGADFDAAYIDAQVKAHRGMLDALKAYSATGEVASLKHFASSLVPVVTGHLNMANGLKS